MEDNLSWLQNLLETEFKESSVKVEDLTGTKDHLEIFITSPDFLGKTLIQQHRMVMEVLKAPLSERIHAVKINTKTP